MKYVVEAFKLYASYGNTVALRDITLSIPMGATILVGPNASGKTTLLRLIAGLLRPSRGRITVLGLDPYKGIGALSRKITYIPETDTLPANAKLREFIEVMAEYAGDDVVRDAVNLLELNKYLDKKIGQLSQGLRRRAAIIEALVSRKELVLLDEPFRGLDKRSRIIVSNALNKLAKEKSIIVSSHLMPLIDFTYAVLLEDGRVTYAGPPGELEPLGCIVVQCGDGRRLVCTREEIKRIRHKRCEIKSIVC